MTRSTTSHATPLKRTLAALGIRQSRLARQLAVSPGTLADLVNHGAWPSRQRQGLRERLAAALRAHGASSVQVNRALGHEAPMPTKQNARRSNAGRSTAAPVLADAAPSERAKEEETMLLQKQTLTPAARQHFGLTADPFMNDVTAASDIYITPDIRYVRETLWQSARHGGLLALVGESGSGKSTLVAELKERLTREGQDVLVIEPSVLYMEENDSKGKTLKSTAIVQSIIATVAPSVPPKRDDEARARQMKSLLTTGHRAGQRYVLLIEEAHCLPTATLKHLKRFSELTDGLHPLLAIVLIGQPELRSRLAVSNAEVREIAQRCGIVELPPLARDLEGYIAFKFKRIGMDVNKIISKEGTAALRERLSFTRRGGAGKGQGEYVSLAYPLAVANALTAAMNLAASLGAPVVDADIAREA